MIGGDLIRRLPLRPALGLGHRLVAEPVGRCLVCGESIRSEDEALRVRGGSPAHRTCATYRMRQRSRSQSRRRLA